MIVVNLDSVIEAPMSTLSLSEIMSSLEWPDNATCATQEIDGEILFCSCPVKDVELARMNADRESGLMPLLGISNQVDSQYTDLDTPEVAYDWRSAVVIKE